MEMKKYLRRFVEAGITHCGANNRIEVQTSEYPHDTIKDLARLHSDQFIHADSVTVNNQFGRIQLEQWLLSKRAMIIVVRYLDRSIIGNEVHYLYESMFNDALSIQEVEDIFAERVHYYKL